MTRLALICATLALATPSEAQMRCGHREDVVAVLSGKHGEVQQSVGFQPGRGLVEVWANEKTGTWTIVVTTPRDISCLMAAGEAYTASADADEPEGAPL